VTQQLIDRVLPKAVHRQEGAELKGLNDIAHLREKDHESWYLVNIV